MNRATLLFVSLFMGCSIEIDSRQIKPLSTEYLNDEKLLNAVIKVESNYNEHAYNEFTGAVGLMQLTPIVYSGVCGLTKEQAFERDRNISCGDLYLHSLLKKYGGNVEKALTYYNNGHIVRNKNYAKKVMKGQNE